MTLFRNKYRIESTRLKGFDYSRNGYYFITICTNKRQCLFGEIIDGEMHLNDSGRIVLNCWNDLQNHYQNLFLNDFVIMPNHLHGILIIDNNLNDGLCGNHAFVETGLRPVSTGYIPAAPASGNTCTGAAPKTKPHGISEFVRALKSFSTRRINELCKTPGQTIWQSRFYDHIIRDQDEYDRIRYYIENNPGNWETDDLYDDNA